MYSAIDKENKLPQINDFSKQRLNRYVSLSLKRGLIKKVGYGTWQLTDKGRAVYEKCATYTKEVNVYAKGTQKEVNVYKPLELDVVPRLSIPIIKELEMPFEPDIERKFNGWVAKYKFVNIPTTEIDLTFLKTTKNLIVHIHRLKLDRLEDLETVIFNVKRWCKEYFATKRIMILDESKARTTYLKYGIGDQVFKKAAPKGEYEEIDLDRPRKKILEADEPTEAKVWFDKSPYDMTVHSNDETYVRRYLLMPETLEKLAVTFVPAIEKLTEQINLHLAATKNLNDGVTEFRHAATDNFKSLYEQIRNMKDTTLNDFTNLFASTERHFAERKELPFARAITKPIEEKKIYPRTFTEAQAKALALDYTLRLIDGLKELKDGDKDRKKMD